MTTYIIRRLIHVFVALILVTFIVFFVMRLLPGNPLLIYVAQTANLQAMPPGMLDKTPGIGIEPPGAAWGAMANDGYRYLLKNPVLSFAPGLAIMLVVFAFNIVDDGLRDALDPRLRGRL
jgi:ABC-type dipeptide/oligopeptide/nickel transport system permease component